MIAMKVRPARIDPLCERVGMPSSSEGKQKPKDPMERRRIRGDWVMDSFRLYDVRCVSRFESRIIRISKTHCQIGPGTKARETT